MSSRVRPGFTFMLAFLTLALSLSFGQKQPAKDKKEQKPDYKIKAAVDMVSLSVVVNMQDGRRVTDLEKKDFQVFEDGIVQEIAGFGLTDEPVSVALMLDTSGSIESRLRQIQDDSIAFTESLHPDDEVAVLSFSQDVTLHKDFSIDRDKNARGIKESRPGGSTVLYEAVWLALDELLKPVKGRKALVLFTDGVDTASRKASMKETLELAKETYAAIYCIYFNTERDLMSRGYGGRRPTVGGFPLPGGSGPATGPVYGPYGRGSTTSEYMMGRDYLQRLSDFSGGRVFDAIEMQDLGPAFDQIAKELASTYSVGYYSSNQKRDGKFRKIEVRVNRPGSVPRTRKGYNARKA